MKGTGGRVRPGGRGMRSCAWPWAVLPATALLITGCGGGGKANPGAARQSGGAMAVQVHVLQPAPLENVITGTGTLLANESVEIRSEMGGRVETIDFQEGGPATAGQLLVKINSDDLQANLRKARSELRLVELTEGRQAQLLAAKGISQETYDATQAQLSGKQAEVDNLLALIAKTTIRAPFSGVLGLRSISQGSYVAPNTPIATLNQVDPMKLDFDVPEQYGRQLKVGGEVRFTLVGDTLPYTATIYAVDPEVNPGTRTVRARARTTNHDGRLAPGAFARIVLDLGTIPGALTVPAEGVIPDVQGQVVMVIRGGKAKAMRVELGLRTEKEVQLISGVQAGDTVITSGLLAVREGMPVRAAEPKAETGNGSTPEAATTAK